MHPLQVWGTRARELPLDLEHALRVVVLWIAARLDALHRRLSLLRRHARHPARVPFWLRPPSRVLWGTSALVLRAVDVDVRLMIAVLERVETHLRAVPTGRHNVHM